MNKRASGVRMHVSSLPGVPNGNWAFRVTQEQLDGIDKKWLKELNDVYYRSKSQQQAGGFPSAIVLQISDVLI